MVNLLHLSDLHFGYDRDATARAQRAEAYRLFLSRFSLIVPDAAIA
jgi:hypothetical protein